MSSLVQRASAAASDPSRGAAAAASRTPRRPAPSPPVPPPPPPQAPEPLPAWLIKLRYLQQKMLWIGMPCVLGLLGLTFWLREIEPHTFNIAPWVDAGAVRAVLLDVGMREVPDPDAALILWTDVDAPAQTGNAVRKQRASVLTGVVSARPDASCTALTAAWRSAMQPPPAQQPPSSSSSSLPAPPADADPSGDGDGERGSVAVSTASGRELQADAGGSSSRALPVPRVATCFVLPSQASDLRHAMVTLDGGRAVWQLEPADAYAVAMAEGSGDGSAGGGGDGSAGGGGGGGAGGGGGGGPPPVLLNNPGLLPPLGAWAARRYDEAPLLLHLRGPRRFSLQLFALVSGLDPLRIYVHHEALLWLAAKPYDVRMLEQLDNADRAPHVTGPRKRRRHARRPRGASARGAGPGGAAATTRQPPWRRGEVLPLASLWRALRANQVRLPPP